MSFMSQRPVHMAGVRVLTSSACAFLVSGKFNMEEFPDFD